jgi:hypothetical protein
MHRLNRTHKLDSHDNGEYSMARCKICGNDHNSSFEMCTSGEVQEFDSIERAFYAVAPRCAQCGSRIGAHGIEASGIFFCSSDCAHQYGSMGSRKNTYQHNSLAV